MGVVCQISRAWEFLVSLRARRTTMGLHFLSDLCAVFAASCVSFEVQQVTPRMYAACCTCHNASRIFCLPSPADCLEHVPTQLRPPDGRVQARVGATPGAHEAEGRAGGARTPGERGRRGGEGRGARVEWCSSIDMFNEEHLLRCRLENVRGERSGVQGGETPIRSVLSTEALSVGLDIARQ